MPDATPEPSYERVKSALLEILDLAPADAEARLDALTREDATLAARVRRLLDAHHGAGAFVDVPG